MCCGRRRVLLVLKVVMVMLAMVAVFYFLLIRPGAKQQKERKSMLEALKKGDVVMTQGGIIGEVVMLDDQRVKLRVAKDVRMQFSRQAIQAILEDKSVVDEG